MYETHTYDAAIIGGGLAGLSLSILLARQGYSVVVVEKEKFPFHKVCGEYISMESWDFLQSLGVDLGALQVPLIRQLTISAPNGKTFETKLPLGGFGISRYKLDAHLVELAKNAGVDVLEETKSIFVNYTDHFEVGTNHKKHAAPQIIHARICCAAYGKRSNLDVKWKRNFVTETKATQNYVGVKYHVRIDRSLNKIELHNFEDGYCGISAIEEGKHCLCYMTTAANLKKAGNDIRQLEEQVLFCNPHLKEIFQSATFLDCFPITISQINFRRKAPVENNVIMLGDAAGTIAPLCGNGMSMALHSSKIAAELIRNFFSGIIDRQELNMLYSDAWNKHFVSRLRTGRILQGFFGNKLVTNFFVGLMRAAPFLARPVISKTHGKPF